MARTGQAGTLHLCWGAGRRRSESWAGVLELGLETCSERCQVVWGLELLLDIPLEEARLVLELQTGTPPGPRDGSLR